MKLLCPKHPTYKAIKQPRSDCDRCWLRWLRQVVYQQGKKIQMIERCDAAADGHWFYGDGYA